MLAWGWADDPACLTPSHISLRRNYDDKKERIAEKKQKIFAINLSAKVLFYFTLF